MLLRRFCSLLSQKSPRSALNVTSALLEPIVQHYNITPFFIDLLSSFKQRVVRTEDGYCSPIRVVMDEKSKGASTIVAVPRDTNIETLETCYMFKFAELKHPSRTTDGRDPWEIRKIGVYHRLDLQTQQSLWIVLSPMPASVAERKITEVFQDSTERDRLSQIPDLVHLCLISCYLSNWKDFCSHHDRNLQDMVRRLYGCSQVTNLRHSQGG